MPGSPTLTSPHAAQLCSLLRAPPADRALPEGRGEAGDELWVSLQCPAAP